MSFSLKQGITWLLILLAATLVVGLSVPSAKGSNIKSETTVATNWRVVKGNIGGSTYSEKDDDFNIGDNIKYNVKVTFDLNGGEKTDGIPVSKIVSTNEEYGTLPLPTRPGYQFAGWFTKPINGIQIQEATIVKINHNHTIYAQWTPNTYFISYYNGTDYLGTQDAVYSQDMMLKTDKDFNISKRGYSFTGWKDDKDIIYKKDVAVKNLTTGLNETVELKADWEPNEYTITFDANGGKNTADETKIVKFDSKVGTMPTPVRQYYDFVGWYTEPNGGTQYTADSIYDIDSDVTLYAHWDICYYTITFIIGDKKFVEKAPQGTMVNIPNTDKVGYTFTGWFTASKGGELITDFNYTTQTVYAQWTPNKYKLTFDADGGTVKPDTKEVTYDDLYGELPVPTKTGYTFNGWKLSNGTKIKKSDTVKITSDSNVIAQWIANKYTVNYFNGNTKLGSSNHVYDQEKALTLISTLNGSKKGYHFKGWSKLAGNNTVSFTDGQIVKNLSNGNNSSVNLYAVWEANEYTVNYYFEGNLIGTSHHVYDSPSNLTSSDDLHVNKTGYYFSGWSKKEDLSGDLLLDEQSVTNLTDEENGVVNLYAVMSANTYKVNYYDRGNLVGTSNAVYDKTFKLKTAKELDMSKTGYHFKGWAVTENGDVIYTDGQNVENLTTNGVYNLYAIWEANEYTVNYFFKYALVGSSKHTYDTISNLTKCNNFTYDKVGYHPIGWATSVNGSLVYSDGQEILNLTNIENGVVNLYMVFEADEYTITLDANGGTVTPSTIKVRYDSTYSNLPSARKDGYYFQGWYLDGKLIKNTDTVKITKDSTFKAQWSENKYTIHYFDRGKEVGSSECVYDAPKKLLSDVDLGISKSGYYLFGWSKSSESTKADFVNGDEVKNLTNEKDGHVNLYAIWMAKGYKLTFDANGGKTSITSKNVTYDSAVGAMPTPTRTGYIFKGWYTNKNWDTQVTTTTIYTTPSDSTVYAKWEAITYNINYYNEGKLVGTSKHTYDVEQSLTTRDELKLSKDAYTFIGWDEKQAASTVVYNNGQLVKNLSSTDGATINLYAVWQANEYTVTYDANGGTVTPESKVVTYNKPYGELATPIKNGYSFVGWYYENTLVTANSIVNIAANHTLKAKWSTNDSTKYTVNHYVMNINGIGYYLYTTDDLTGETDSTIPFSAIKRNITGFTYEKVILDNNDTEEPSSVTGTTVKPNGDRVINFYYSRNKYTVGLAKGNGIKTVTSSFTAYYEADVSVSATAKDGYQFSHWLSSNVLIEDSEDNPYVFKMPAGDVNLTAMSEANTFTIKYDANCNDATGTMEDSVYKFNENNPLRLNQFIRTGYSFDGWNLYRIVDGNAEWLYGDKVGNWINGNSWYTVNNAPSGYKKFNFIDGQSVKDITYKNNDLIIASAQWKINKYTLTVDPNGGTWGDGTSTQYFTQNYGTSRMLPVPIKTGYTFNGWHGTSSLRLFGRALYSDDQFLKGTNNMTVYNNAGNGTVTLNKITSSAALNTGSNKNIIQITSNGSASPGTGGFVQSTLAKKNNKYYHVIVAKIPVGYKINDARNSIGTGGSSTWLTSQEGTGNWATYIYQVNAGYTGTFSTFGHVYLTGGTNVTWQVAYAQVYNATNNVYYGNTGVLYNYPATNETLTAQWKANTYYITFDNNGGTGGPSSQAFKYNGNEKITTKVPTKAGYKFAGWKYNNTTYQPGATIPNGLQNFTLVAQWDARDDVQYIINKYTMDIDGENYSKYSSATYYGVANATISIAKYNTDITGMSYSKAVLEDGTVLTGTNTTINADGSRIINMYYSRNKYTISLVKGSGIATVLPSETITEYYGKKISVSASPADGYKFTSWSSSDTSAIANSTDIGYSFIVPAKDVTLTANATGNSYNVVYYKKVYDDNGNVTNTIKLGSSRMYFDVKDSLATASSLGIDKAENHGRTSPGHYFVGWDTSSAASTVVYEDEQNVLNLTSTPNGNYNLYAVYSNLGERIAAKGKTFNTFPIGHIMATTSSDDPSTIYGGTWKRIMEDRIPVGVDETDADFATAGIQAGQEEVTLGTAQIPSHKHDGTTSANGSHSHSWNLDNVQTSLNAAEISICDHAWISTSHSGSHYKLMTMGITDGGNHGHSFVMNSSGGGKPHNNMQPYQGVYYWEKIAD